MGKIEQRLFDLEEYLMRNDDRADSSAYLTIVGTANDASELETENAKLRELCADMLMCLTWTNEPHGYMEDGCNCCRFRGKTHGACGLGMFKGRSAELGVEVDE